MITGAEWVDQLTDALERFKASRGLREASVRVHFVDGVSTLVATTRLAAMDDHVILVPGLSARTQEEAAVELLTLPDGREVPPTWMVVPLTTILRTEILPEVVLPTEDEAAPPRRIGFRVEDDPPA